MKRHLPLNHHKLATRCGIRTWRQAYGYRGTKRGYFTRAGSLIEFTEDRDHPDLCQSCKRRDAKKGKA